MNIEEFKNLKESSELLTISKEINLLINLFGGNKKALKPTNKTGNQILKNPKLQNLKDKIENKVNLILNKLSELNINNLCFEFVESFGKISEEEYEDIQKAFYCKFQSDIGFIKVYLDFFKIISNVYQKIYNYKSETLINVIYNKFMNDYCDMQIDEKYLFLDNYTEETKRINNLTIILNLISTNMLNQNIKNEIDNIILNQNKYYADIYYWFQNRELTPQQKAIIKNKINNNSLALREKVLLDNLMENKHKEHKSTEVSNIKNEIINGDVDTLKLEIENIIDEYIELNDMEEIKLFIESRCIDALSKNKFCQIGFNKYFEGSINESNLILEMMKNLIKKQILFKSNLSRGILLIHNNWEEVSLDYNNPNKKMKELLLTMKSMGITKFLETLMKEYKIEITN